MRPTALPDITWRKSSYSTGNPACVEVARTDALTWRKSSRSGGKLGCVEVAQTQEIVAVRDSKDPNGPALVVSPAAFARFLTSVK